MVKIEENKILSVIVDSAYEIQVSDEERRYPKIFFVGNGEPEYFDTWHSSQDITTIEELKVFASWWYENNVGEERVVESFGQEIPTLAQLKIYSQNAMMVEVKGIKFIIGEEVPILHILHDDEVVTDYIEVGDENEICDIAVLERYAIKWYYKNILGMDF